MSSDKVQILVVDDDISHCTILQALLRGWGYQVALATTAGRRWSRSIIRFSTWYCAIFAWRSWTVSQR